MKKAVDADPNLAPVTKVFVQGSYRNRVNVRLDSDVDIGVLYTGDNLFGTHYPAGRSHTDFGNESASYDLEIALKRHFGRSKVGRGSKAFDIHENTYRVDADVVPLIAYRHYTETGFYICGTQLVPDNGYRVINWPERLYDDPHWQNQHYENGHDKNKKTSRAYRATVRILKKLRNRVDQEGVAAAKPIKGFLVECLVWNVPDTCFTHNTWHEVVIDILDHLAVFTSNAILCDDWHEVNDIKYLFKHDEQKRAQAAAFITQARNYIR